MSDFFKKAAGIIFNIEEEGAKDKTEEKQPSQQPATQTSVPNIPHATAPIATGGHDDQATKKFAEYFQKLYQSANLPGPDFHEFNNMIEAMGNLIPDNVKYPSVYAGFGGQLTKEKLLSSADEYLRIMIQDKRDFERSLQDAQKSKVHDRKLLIEKKLQQIKELQDQIGKLNNEIVELNKLSEQDAARLTSENAAYFQQSELVCQRIKWGKAKIMEYIN